MTTIRDLVSTSNDENGSRSTYRRKLVSEDATSEGQAI